MATQHPLDDLLYDQTNLALLCRECAYDWEEYAHMNEFHGNASVLRRYAGLAQEHPLPFAVEHAIPFDLEQPYEYDLNCALPVFLTVHDGTADLYRKGGISIVHPIGSCHLYAMELFGRLHPLAGNVARRGTLVFPDKSTKAMDTDFDREAFAARLASLPEEFKPVVVCTYWRDHVRGLHVAYERAGLPVVTCGNLRDGCFQLRLHDLCRRFRYSCANDLAGSFIYSVLSGCHFFHLPAGPVTMLKNGQNTCGVDPTLDKPHKAACLAASPFPPGDPAPQAALAARHAGVAFKKTADELVALWHEARRSLAQRLVAGHIALGAQPDMVTLHALLPVGLDRDGWVRRQASLRAARSSQVAALRFSLELLKPKDTEDQRVDIFVNGRHMQTLCTPRFKHTVLIPLLETAAETVIEFRSSHEILLMGEDRTRAFRMTGIDVLPPEQLHAALSAGTKKKHRPQHKPARLCPSTPPPRSFFSRLGRIFRQSPRR